MGPLSTDTVLITDTMEDVVSDTAVSTLGNITLNSIETTGRGRIRVNLSNRLTSVWISEIHLLRFWAEVKLLLLVILRVTVDVVNSTGGCHFFLITLTSSGVVVRTPGNAFLVGCLQHPVQLVFIRQTIPCRLGIGSDIIAKLHLRIDGAVLLSVFIFGTVDLLFSEAFYFHTATLISDCFLLLQCFTLAILPKL